MLMCDPAVSGFVYGVCTHLPHMMELAGIPGRSDLLGAMNTQGLVNRIVNMLLESFQADMPEPDNTDVLTYLNG